VFHIVEPLRQEHALVRLIIGFFRESQVIDIVGASPGIIRPVGTLLDDVVLQIMLGDEKEAGRVGAAAEAGQAARGRRIRFIRVLGFGTKVKNKSLPLHPLWR